MKHVRPTEPQAVKEVHVWRRKLQKRAEKVGWPEHLKRLNERPGILTTDQAAVVRECPSKYKPR